MRKIIVFLMATVMLVLVSCGDDSQTDSDIQFGYDFGDYGWGYELSETEEETEPETEPEYDYLVDIFEDVEDWLEFSGAGDECSVKLEIPKDYSRETNGLYIKRVSFYTNVVELIYNNKSMGYFSFYIDNATNLSVGDIVTIYSNNIYELNNNLLQNGFYIKDSAYQISYPDMGSYISSWEEAVNIYDVLDEKAKECYCKYKNIDINSKEAENVKVPLFSGVYGEIKPDEVLNSESRRVMAAVPVYVMNSYGYYSDYVVYMSGIVIESEEKTEGEYYTDEDVRIEHYIVQYLNTDGYSSFSDAVLAATAEKYDEYNWHQ